MHVHHAIWGNSTFGYNIARLQVVHNLINNNCQWTNLCTRNEIQKLKKCSPLLDDPTSFEPRPLCYEWATTLWKLSMPQVGSLCGHDHSQMPANERSKHFFGLWEHHKCISPFAICWDLNSFANLECSLSFSDFENNVHSFTLRRSTNHAIFFTAVCQRDLQWVTGGPLFAVSFIVVFLPWRMRFFIITVEFCVGSMICNPSA